MINIPFFPNASIQLNTYCGYDEDGDPYYEPRETITADIQPLSPTSSMQIFGEILQDTYKVYLAKDVEIHETDQLIIKDNKYEIVGSVENWNHILPYQKITIKKQRKTI